MSKKNAENIILKDVRYIGSFPRHKACPVDDRPCFGFIGRSNVGKSSLINMLCKRKDLAKTSNTPGKTQMINYFSVNDSMYLVDLPGYGYARVSKKQRNSFTGMIATYLESSEHLITCFVLLDLRHKLQQVDLEFINWLGEKHIPFTLIYTKADKIKPGVINSHLNLIRNPLLEFWENLPMEFITSAKTGQGREEIWHFMRKFEKIS